MLLIFTKHRFWQCFLLVVWFRLSFHRCVSRLWVGLLWQWYRRCAVSLERFRVLWKEQLHPNMRNVLIFLPKLLFAKWFFRVPLLFSLRCWLVLVLWVFFPKLLQPKCSVDSLPALPYQGF